MLDLDAFPPVRGYLDTATVGVPPIAAADATRATVDAWAAGQLATRLFDPVIDRARSSLASIAGCKPEDVAQGSTAAQFVGLVASSLPDRARVLLADGDFTSVLFPLLAHGDRLDITSVAPDLVPEAIDATTDLVAVSAVQSANGRVADIDALANAAEHHGAAVLLDATQALGWLPLDTTRFSYVVAAAYKWLLAPRGVAFLIVRPEAKDRLRPVAANWYAGADRWDSIYGAPLRLAADARRFDLSPAWICWPGAAAALEWIATTGVDALHAHATGLAERLRAGLGLEPWPTCQSGDRRRASAIVSLDRRGAGEALAAAGIRTAIRAGRTRISCHVPATIDDVDRALDVLAG